MGFCGAGAEPGRLFPVEPEIAQVRREPAQLCARESGMGIGRIVEKFLAARVAENGPLALIASKAIVRDSHEWTEENMWDKQASYIAPVFTSSDAREGAAAFAEKRKPNWQGK